MNNNINFQINVVLVRSLYDRNIGSSSRAMANMGAHRLILVNPQCEVTYEAQLAAATGQEALQKRTTYSSMSEFLSSEPEGLRIAFSARDGRGRLSRDFTEAMQWLKSHSHFFINEEPTLPQETFLYLIFGAEDAGLNSEEIKDAHYCCCLPTFGNNSSLNLSQAVLLALFILRQNIGGQRTLLDGQQKPRELENLPSILPDESLKLWLEALGLDLSSKKINAHSVLKRMLLQNTPTAKEYQMLETMVQQTVRKLNRLKELEKKMKSTEPL